MPLTAGNSFIFCVPISMQMASFLQSAGFQIALKLLFQDERNAEGVPAQTPGNGEEVLFPPQGSVCDS